MNKYIEETNSGLVHTYNRFPLVLDRGEGVYLYDEKGGKYLDFAGGIAVSGLGYGCQELNDALKSQIDKMIHSSNLYYNTTCGHAAEELKRISGMDRVFFTNSGTEAIEGADVYKRQVLYRLQQDRAMGKGDHAGGFYSSVSGRDSLRDSSKWLCHRYLWISCECKNAGIPFCSPVWGCIMPIPRRGEKSSCKRSSLDGPGASDRP